MGTKVIRLIAFLGVLFFAATAAAQQTPVPTLVWDYDVPTTEVATYTQAVTVDGFPVTTTPTCTVRANVPAETTCSVALPALAAGAHNVSISATKNGITATTSINGLDPSTGAHNPRTPRIVISVTVTVN